MEFRVLGPLEVAHDGERLPLGSVKHRALLAVLLLSPNHVVSTDQLIDRLWGERPPRGAAASVHVYVSHLRRALSCGPVDGGQLLVTRRPGYLIQVDPGQLDSVRFERLVATGRRSLEEGSTEVAAGTLGEALALWRGDALADLAAEEFARPEALRLTELRVGATEDRVEADLLLGRHLALVAELEQLVAAHPFRERLRGQLMVALYRSGRQADALAAYRQGRAELIEQLGLEPGPALQRLEGRVLRQDPGLDWQGDDRPHRARGDPTARPSGVDAAPFVGREAELAALQGALEALRSGRGALVLIAGEAGIGKTCLAEQLAGTAGRAGVRVLWGRCYEGEGAPPFWPWTQALRALTGRDGAPSGAPQAARMEALTLADALAGPRSAAQRRTDPAAGSEPGLARFRMFDAVTTHLREVARREPLVVVVDDLHRADDPSLALLVFLVRDLASMPVLVLGLYRDTDAGQENTLTDTIGALSQEPVTSRLDLAGLSGAELVQLLEAAGSGRAHPLGAALHARTEGNPFFVRQILRLLEADGRLGDDRVDIAALPIPSSVREVIRSRLARLSPAARSALETASVMGREFELDVLQGLRRSDDQLPLVEEALRVGLVDEDHGTVGRFRFTHALVQESLYEGLSAVRRARVHGAVAACLEALSSEATSPEAVSARTSQLSHHFLQAARAGIHEGKTLHYATQAARAATGALAYEEAVAQYERALQALALMPRPAAARRGELLLELGDARWRAGNVPGARAVFLEAAELARSDGDHVLLGRAALGWGGGPYRGWHAARGEVAGVIVDHLETALEGLGALDSDLRVRLLGSLAEQLYDAGHEHRRDELSRQALEMARRLADPSTLASALCSRCLAVWDPRHVAERLELSGEIVETATRLGNRELGLFGRRHRFVACMELGRVDEAASVLDDFDRLADELRQPLYRWESRWLRAVIVMFKGGFEEGERLAWEALELGQSTHDPDALSIFGAQLALLRSEQDRLAEMREAVVAFSEEFADVPAWRAGVALMNAQLGRTDEARASFEDFASGDFGVPFDFVWLSTQVMLAQTCAILTERTSAVRIYELLRPFAGHNVLTADRNCWGPVDRYLGLLAATAGDLDAAARHLADALAASRSSGSRPWEAHARHDLARVLLVRDGLGDRRRAAELVAGAVGIADELGMRRLLVQASTLSVDLVPAGPLSAGSLSAGPVPAGPVPAGRLPADAKTGTGGR